MGGICPLPWAQPSTQDRFGKWRKGKCRAGSSVTHVPPHFPAGSPGWVRCPHLGCCCGSEVLVGGEGAAQLFRGVLSRSNPPDRRSSGCFVPELGYF